MSIEKPTESNLTPEDIAEIEKQRAAHQVKMRVGDAKWVEDDAAHPENSRLRVTDEQFEAAHKEMEGDLNTHSTVSERAPSSVLTEEERDALMNGLKSETKKSGKSEKGLGGLKNKTKKAKVTEKKEKVPKKKVATKKVEENEADEEEIQRNSQEKEIAKLERELSKKSKAGASKEELGELEARRDQLKKELEASDREEAAFWTKNLDALPLEQKKAELEKIFSTKSQEGASKEELREIEKARKELSDEEKHSALLAELKEVHAGKTADRYGFADTNIGKTLGRGIFDTIGSIVGFRVLPETWKLIGDALHKKGAKDAANELLEEVAKRNAPGALAVQSPEEKTQEQSFWKRGLAKIGITFTEQKTSEEKAEEKDAKLSQNKINLVDAYLTGTKLSEEQKEALHGELEAALRENTSPYVREQKLTAFNEKLAQSGLSSEQQAALSSALYEKPSPVQERIANFNKKLQSVKRPEEDKKALRHELAAILWQNRHASEKINAERTEDIASAFDTYANNTAQLMTVAREAVNTVSVATFSPWLRLYGYTAFSVGGEVLKANNEFDKKHFYGKEPEAKERFNHIAKSVTVDKFNESRKGWGNLLHKDTYQHGLKHFWKESGNVVFSNVMTGMRLAGIYEFEHALASGNVAMEAGQQAFWQAVDKGHVSEAIAQGGTNLVTNADRLLSHVGLAENPDKAAYDLINAGHIKEAALTERVAHVAASKAEFHVTPEIEKLATIHKGEGVINAFQRQIEHNPQSFGYHGDMHNEAAKHLFARHEAYKIALEKKIIDPNNCSELRVRFDVKHPTEFILHPDHSYTESAGGHTYAVEPGSIEHAAHHVAAHAGHATHVEHAPNVHTESTKPETHRVLDNAKNSKEQFAHLGNLVNKDNMRVKLDGGGEVMYWFNKKGEFDRITFTHALTSKESTDMWNYLKPNWQQIQQMGSVPRLNLPMANQEIRLGLGNIIVMDKALAQLRMAKHMNSQQYSLILKSLEGTVANMQARYGKIFQALSINGKDITS